MPKDKKIPTHKIVQETPGSRVVFQEEGDLARLESVGRIVDPEQLLRLANIDLEVWEVEKTRINKWEVGRKDRKARLRWKDGVVSGKMEDSGKISVEPLIQVQIWLRRRRDVVDLKAIREGILEDLRAQAPRVAPRRYPSLREGLLYLPAIPDLHVDKLAWGQESGQDYDSEISIALFEQKNEELLEMAARFPISRICLPVGNDLFNANDRHNLTAKGTPQQVDSRWPKIFRMVREMYQRAIRRFEEIAPVDVIMIGGNHDPDRVYYLGEVLEALYCHNPNVTVYNAPTLRKYYTFGLNLLGFTHGSEEKVESLPMIMSSEASDLWSQSKYREWILGHIHRKREVKFLSVYEDFGVRVRYIPSLSATDRWHYERGFIGNIRAAEALLYHPFDGYVGQFSRPVYNRVELLKC